VEILDVQTYVSHKKIINLRKANDPVNQRGGGMGPRLAQVNKGRRWSVDQPVVVGRSFYT